jgi:enoyl-CoA hydratase/carnithine racemase
LREEAAMAYENIIFDVVEGIATITFNRPKRSMR